MSSFTSYCCALMVCVSPLLCALQADESNSSDPATLTYREAIVGQDPMGLDGFDRQIASILRNYYERSFGGRENWDAVESFRFEGELRMPQQTVDFVAYKKKPDNCKIVFSFGQRVEITMAYDGADAWQLGNGEFAADTMVPLDALNFIRDAPIAGHLLYPSLPGKRIELLGKRMIDGHACYELRVTLPNGQQVSYAIDRSDFIERQQSTVNAVSGATEVTTHLEFKKIAGVAIPMRSVTAIDGEQLHEIQMELVEANRGVASWMFARPVSGGLSRADGSGSFDALNSTSSGLSSSGANLDTFGLEEPVTSVFEETRFPDLDFETKVE